MQEPTASRSLGSDGTWPAWPRAVDRPDPQSDVARLDPARGTPVEQPPAPFGVEDAGKSTAERLKDASFPRAYARFEMNKQTQRLCIKIVDAATDEVIREIPSDEVQRIAYELQAMSRRVTIGKWHAGSSQPGDGTTPVPSGAGVDRYV